MDPLLMMLLVFGGMMLVMSMMSRKQRGRMEATRDQAIGIGKTVRTHSGFYGTIVDIDGQTVTLESPSGHESLWHRNAIFREEFPPYAEAEEEASAAEFGAGAANPSHATEEPEYGERINSTDDATTSFSADDPAEDDRK